MKTTVLLGELTRGLSGVGRVVSARGNLPVLGNVLIEAGKEGVTLTATNLELGIRMAIGGKVAEEGAVTVPAKNLGEFTTSLAGETVSMESEGEKLTVKAGKFEGVFAGIAATEFPQMPRLGDKEIKTQKLKTGRKAIDEIAREVAYAAATDESRPVLTGIRFQTGEGNLTVVATDGFRLSRKTVEGGALAGMGDLILPARTILETAKTASESEGAGELVMGVLKDNNQVIFGTGKTEMISRVLEGNFPDVEKIIPGEHKTKMIVDREDLMRAVRAAAVFARESNNIIKLTIGEGGLIIRAAASQTGESEIELEADCEGEESVMAFNYRYVMDFLNSVTDERVILKTSGSLAPGVWMPEKREDLLHLIMPVRV